MADIHRTRTIAARVGEIWDVLADFGSISAWADNVDHSCILFSGTDGGLLGTARRVQVKRDTLVERITEFDPPHALAYDIEGLPSRVRVVSNRWTLAATAAGSAQATLVTLTSTVEIGSRPSQKLAERVLCRFLARQSDVMLAGLANRLENARV
ncbi:MAG: SRPBCC family protein [Mycobacterium sp.]|uniref:SRPBCC family protein n=1 Tax=Mycobacterium sp. TaxID=1785 RepID=UPI003F9E7AF0